MSEEKNNVSAAQHEETHKDKNILSSLNHALKILDLLSVRSNLGVSEISRITGYDKASVYKMLYTMQHRGYVVKTADARYAISSKLSANGTQAQTRQNVVDVSVPYVRRLRDVCGQTVLLGVLNINGKVIFTYKEEGLYEDSIRTRTAYEIDAYTNASGKLLLANLDPSMQENIISGIQFYAHTPLTITDASVLSAELEKLGDASFAEQYDENFIGHADIAAPIRDESGRVIAALSIACNTEILKEQRELFLPLLLDSANAISREMGWRE